MANRNISATVQIGATMSASVGAVFGGLKKRMDDVGGSLAKLKKRSSEITKLQTAQGRLAEAKAKGSATAVARYTAEVARLSKALEEAGVDTANLAREQDRLTSSITNSQARLASLTRMGMSMNRIGQVAGRVGGAFANVRTQVMGLTTKLAALGAGAGYLFKTQFVDTAAEFERLQTILTTLEGGNVTKAKQAFGWISEFAAKTPYDIKQVSEAFVRLRAYGIDPIKGDTLRVLGDTASSMGKDVMSAVEAIADAVTGENERLKEFGIKAAKQGGQIIYSYTDRAGKQRQKAVDAGNRKLIQSTLTAIWNEKYAGAMDAQSRTWAGMMSNLGDQWTRFTTTVMASGLFDWMKTEVGGILEELNKAAADGRLKAWAQQVGQAIKEAFIALKEFGIQAKDVIIQVKDFVGGWKNLGAIMAAVAFAPTIASVVQLTTACWSLGAAVLAATGPWGLFAAGVVAVGAAVYKFKDEILDLINAAIDPLLDKLRAVGAWFADSRVGKFFGLNTNNLDGTPQTQRAAGPFVAPKSTEELKSDLLKKIMPAENMPGASAMNNVKQEFQINVTAPSQNAADIAAQVKSAIKNLPLYDSTGVLAPQ